MYKQFWYKGEKTTLELVITTTSEVTAGQQERIRHALKKLHEELDGMEPDKPLGASDVPQ